MPGCPAGSQWRPAAAAAIRSRPSPADGRAWSFNGHYVSGQELPAPAVAVVDADSGVLLSLAAFSGEQQALHAELRELTFEPQPRDDDFRIAPSPGVIVTEQDDDDVDADEIF